MALTKRTARWMALAALLLVTIAGIWLGIQRFSAAEEDFAANQLVLPVLVMAIVVLALGLAGVLIRNLVRLILDRKRGILGSKLRTKLVFFFLAFVLLPALVLFYGSAAVIRSTVEAMVRTPVEDVTRGAREIVDGWTEAMKGQCRQLAVEAAAEAGRIGIADEARRADVAALAGRWLGRESLDLVVVLSGDTPVARAIDPELLASGTPVESVVALSRALASRAVAGNGSATGVDTVGGGLLVQAAAPLPLAPGEIGRPRGALVVGTFLSRNLAGRMEQITSGADKYRRFRIQRRDLVRLYRALMGLILLGTVFVATWIGFYLSRRITEPIQELAAAAREISGGNLGVRVRAEAGDEVGMLVDAFNDMAAQLQESREVITRSTADLRRSNEALDERRRYIETLVANLSSAVVSLDPGGRVTTANPASRDILGLDLAPGDDFRGKLVEPGLESLSELMEEVARRPGDSHRRDLDLVHNRQRVSVSFQSAPLRGGQGEELGTLVMVEDLTELLRAQRAAAWSEVARRLAHEIKNPLTPIQLAAQRLRKKFQEGAEDLPEVVADATATVEREVGALKNLVDEFSRFARMPEPVPRPVEFRAVIDAVLALYRGVQGIRWEVETSRDLGLVRVDGEQLRRALINLIDNALTAMDQSGTVRITARRYAGPGSLRVEVADTGPGIPPGDRDRLFLPYFSTKRRGTGLGLAIVHRVVTDHQGSIRVEDNRPRGARFVIEIPA
ncbi:MAG: HAMP domain-containing protein [Acidobacteriia bacterium]|nr:HAMP domain-containing protein [Terriglobia bacterium]